MYNESVSKAFSENSKKVTLNLLKLCISISLLYYVFKDTDLKQLLVQITQTSPIGLLGYLGLSIFLVFLASYRWSLFLLEKPSFTEVKTFFRANMIALFYNLFLPTAYGGDLVKWTHLDSIPQKKSTIIFSVFADRILGLMGLITVGFVASSVAKIYNLAEVPTALFLLFALLFIGLLIGLVIIFTSIRASQLPILKKFTIISELEEYIYARKQRFMYLYGLAIVIQILSFVCFYLLALEANLAIPFIYFLIISPVVSLISVLPISVAGFGTTEAAYLYFFIQLGASKETILLFMSLFGIFKILLGVIGWIIELVVTSKNFAWAAIKN